MSKIKIIAYYLPQFHRLKFNDDYWGKGFTEWTNTAKAKPLFKGHYQPHIPADLGFYDLSLASVREEQANLAKEYGIDGFCYWHYWFGKDMPMMEMPFDSVVESGSPDFPFCIAWANHDWHNLKTKEVIIKQRYEGRSDYDSHFKSLEKAFKDKRYIKIDGKPVVVIYSPFEIDDIQLFFSVWKQNAQECGLNGLYFIGIVKNDIDAQKALDLGYDGVNIIRLHEFECRQNTALKHFRSIYRRIFRIPYRYKFKNVMKYFCGEYERKDNVFPTIISGWDHTPRSGKKALILTGYTPEIFGEHIDNVLQKVVDKKISDSIVFVRAWNEWAEGNHLEPDLKFGLKFLQVLKNKLELYNDN